MRLELYVYAAYLGENIDDPNEAVFNQTYELQAWVKDNAAETYGPNESSGGEESVFPRVYFLNEKQHAMFLLKFSP